VQIASGTRAFVTGASRGIGRALACALAERGAVVGLAARSSEELEALASELPGEHQVVPCDVSDRDDVGAAVDVFADRVGGLELVVANAGLTHYEPFFAQAPAHVRQMVDVNLLGTLWTVQAGLPHLLRAGRGHIVVVSSGAGLRAFPSAAVYGATKAAQRAFAEALRHELAGTGVSLTTAFPGEIATSLHDHERERMPAWYRASDALPAETLAAQVLAAVEADRRAVFVPPAIRLLGALNAVAPRAADALLRRLRGVGAAPRRG
jgi:NADP-dependent 3-hydroxy acid dehydrogenase YdfG